MTATKSVKRGRKRKVGPREPNGRLSRAKSEDATLTVLHARIRQNGPEWFAHHGADPADPLCGCMAGRIIIEATPAGQHMPRSARETALQRRQALWAAANHVRRCYRAYAATQGLPAPHAQVLRILAPVDAMQASADDPPPDLRSAAERASGAEAAWWNVRNVLFALPGRTRHAVEIAVVTEEPLPVPAAEVITGLQAVADWLEGRVRPASE